MHFKVLLLTGKVTAPRLKTVKIKLKLLNVANRYIFKCLSVIKDENGGRIPGFLDGLGPVLVIN